MAREISLLKAGIAHDLQLIRNGEQGDEYEHLKYICLDKLSPKYNLVKVLMLNINSVEEAPKQARSKKDTEESETKDTIAIAGELDPDVPSIAPKGNLFEEASKRIMQKNASRR